MWNRGDISGTDWISDGVKYIEHLTVQQTLQFQEKSEKWKDPFGNICRLLDNVWRLRMHSEIFINWKVWKSFPQAGSNCRPGVGLNTTPEFASYSSPAEIRIEILFSNWFHHQGTSLQAPSAMGNNQKHHLLPSMFNAPFIQNKYWKAFSWTVLAPKQCLLDSEKDA